MFYFAKDNSTRHVSPLVQSRVYKALEGNQPPGTFDLVAPVDNTAWRTSVMLSWQDTTDPDEDNMTYSVLLYKVLQTDPLVLADPLYKEGLTFSSCLIGPVDGIEDSSTYYWKVQAIDAFGAVRETGTRSFHTNNTNPILGWIEGHVYNQATGVPVVNANVAIESTDLTTGDGGYFLGVFQPGNYNIIVTATGYETLNTPGVVIPEGDLTTKDFSLAPVSSEGDINGDGPTNLADAVMAMQIMVGLDPGQDVYLQNEVNDNSQIDLEEAVFILQKTAGLR
jgi:hypothetical protein